MARTSLTNINKLNPKPGVGSRTMNLLTTTMEGVDRSLHYTIMATGDTLELASNNLRDAVMDSRTELMVAQRTRAKTLSDAGYDDEEIAYILGSDYR